MRPNFLNDAGAFEYFTTFESSLRAAIENLNVYGAFFAPENNNYLVAGKQLKL